MNELIDIVDKLEALCSSIWRHTGEKSVLDVSVCPQLFISLQKMKYSGSRLPFYSFHENSLMHFSFMAGEVTIIPTMKVKNEK